MVLSDIDNQATQPLAIELYFAVWPEEVKNPNLKNKITYLLILTILQEPDSLQLQPYHMRLNH